MIHDKTTPQIKCYLEPFRMTFASMTRGNTAATQEQFELMRKGREEKLILSEMSQNSQRKLRRCFGWLVYKVMNQKETATKRLNAIKRHMAVVTLSLTQDQWSTDEFIKKQCLNPFLTLLRKHHKNLDYVWKAERQQNGRIHFHLILDRYVAWEWLNNAWANILYKNGYMQEWKEGTRTIWPKCVDVRGCSKAKNAYLYLCKYLSKDVGALGIEGRLWGASYGLVHLGKVEFSLSMDEMEKIEEAVNNTTLIKITSEDFTFYSIDIISLCDHTYLRPILELKRHFQGLKIFEDKIGQE